MQAFSCGAASPILLASFVARNYLAEQAVVNKQVSQASVAIVDSDMRWLTRAYASASVISFGEMRSYACYPSSELVGEGISVLLGCTRDLS